MSDKGQTGGEDFSPENSDPSASERADAVIENFILQALALVGSSVDPSEAVRVIVYDANVTTEIAREALGRAVDDGRLMLTSKLQLMAPNAT